MGFLPARQSGDWVELATGVGIAPTPPGLQPGVQTDYTIQWWVDSARQRDFNRRCAAELSVFSVLRNQHDNGACWLERNAEPASRNALGLVAAADEQSALETKWGFHVFPFVNGELEMACRAVAAGEGW